jgi:signal transduction histidine kinase
MPNAGNSRPLNRTFHVLFSATLLGLLLLAAWTVWPTYQQANERISTASAAARWSGLAPRVSLSFLVIMIAIAMLYWVTMRLLLTRLTQLARAAASLARAEIASQVPYTHSRDELGLLARALEALRGQCQDELRRHELEIRERAKRDHETLRVIGHHIRSPIQALLALNPPASRSRPYIDRISTAVQAVFGPDALPDARGAVYGEAVGIDLSDFIGQLTANAAHVGIDAIEFHALDKPTLVELDDGALSDALVQILTHADRLRYPGSAIRIFLAVTGGSALITVASEGPTLATEQLEAMFEFVALSGPGSLGCRGQGLFIARELVLRMRGIISASNHTDGVEIQVVLPLPRALRCA